MLKLFLKAICEKCKHEEELEIPIDKLGSPFNTIVINGIPIREIPDDTFKYCPKCIKDVGK